MSSGIDFMAAVVEKKRARLKDAQAGASFYNLRAGAYDVRSNASRHALRQALGNETQINVIAEIKRASPSKGDLGLKGTIEETATAYERGGAVAISVLTEEDYFKGSLADLRAVRRAVALPVLRKDFIFDDYQVYEAAAAGADALLLIVALLDDETLLRLRTIAETELGMDALIEVHTREEMRRASASGASLIGVNNRNLHTFEVSIDVSVELRSKAPAEAVLVSESGLRSGAELKQLRGVGYNGFLIGEALVASNDPEAALRAMINEAEE
ncbi:MAG TPA: indole-3-glycerol phosphate synthase TrpC [Pyrinomonadaceae bacterium]|nr:indole-3-glycerol phosphate synthase TrpC [Pyrinomonadaceae bacterium]